MTKAPIEFEIVEEELDEDLDDEEEEENEDELEELEEIEFDLTGEEINGWIDELTRLKEEKESIKMQIDGDLYLKINYYKEEGEED